MNQLTTINSVATMSSREIAKLCKKEHRNVTPVIRDLIDKQILTAEIQQCSFLHSGNTYIEYLCNKRDSLVIVARLSPEFTAAVIDRWQELELKQTTPTELTRKDILLLALAAEERAEAAEAKVEQQTLLIEQQKPQVEFANDVANTCDSISVGGYAGLLASSGFEIGQNRLFAWLREHGYLTSRNNRPSINAIDSGLLRWIETTYICPKTGFPKLSGKAVITGKGQIHLRKKLIKEEGVK